MAPVLAGVLRVPLARAYSRNSVRMQELIQQLQKAYLYVVMITYHLLCWGFDSTRAAGEARDFFLQQE